MNDGTPTRPARNVELGASGEEFQNLHEFIRKARSRLNQNAWDYIVGASETETTMRRNRMRCKDATPAASVSAANAILDRGWGKATQPLESAVDGALELIQRIERVIVYFAKRGFENVARIMKRRLALKPRMSEPLLSRRSPNNRSFGKARSMPWS